MIILFVYASSRLRFCWFQDRNTGYPQRATYNNNKTVNNSNNQNNVQSFRILQKLQHQGMKDVSLERTSPLVGDENVRLGNIRQILQRAVTTEIHLV